MDKEFFVREIEGSSGMLYRVAYSILQDDDACADALQETVLKAWEKRGMLREERYFRTWVTRILINTCRSMRKARFRLVPIDAAPEPVAAPPDTVLSLAVSALPEELRLPLVLCYSEGMSYAEIATTLRLPATTVRGRIHRAKKALRKELDAE